MVLCNQLQELKCVCVHKSNFAEKTGRAEEACLPTQLEFRSIGLGLCSAIGDGECCLAITQLLQRGCVITYLTAPSSRHVRVCRKYQPLNIGHVSAPSTFLPFFRCKAGKCTSLSNPMLPTQQLVLPVHMMSCKVRAYWEVCAFRVSKLSPCMWMVFTFWGDPFGQLVNELQDSAAIFVLMEGEGSQRMVYIALKTP